MLVCPCLFALVCLSWFVVFCCVFCLCVCVVGFRFHALVSVFVCFVVVIVCRVGLCCVVLCRLFYVICFMCLNLPGCFCLGFFVLDSPCLFVRFVVFVWFVLL